MVYDEFDAVSYRHRNRPFPDYDWYSVSGASYVLYYWPIRSYGNLEVCNDILSLGLDSKWVSLYSPGTVLSSHTTSWKWILSILKKLMRFQLLTKIEIKILLQVEPHRFCGSLKCLIHNCEISENPLLSISKQKHLVVKGWGKQYTPSFDKCMLALRK